MQAVLAEGTNRVVLFTDGQANVGITAISDLVALARGAASERVTTTCIGFGASFNEELMRDMSGAGGGNYWYVEATDQMTGMFDEEIEGASRNRRKRAPRCGRTSWPIASWTRGLW